MAHAPTVISEYPVWTTRTRATLQHALGGTALAALAATVAALVVGGLLQSIGAPHFLAMSALSLSGTLGVTISPAIPGALMAFGTVLLVGMVIASLATGWQLVGRHTRFSQGNLQLGEPIQDHPDCHFLRNTPANCRELARAFRSLRNSYTIEVDPSSTEQKIVLQIQHKEKNVSVLVPPLFNSAPIAPAQPWEEIRRDIRHRGFWTALICALQYSFSEKDLGGTIQLFLTPREGMTSFLRSPNDEAGLFGHDTQGKIFKEWVDALLIPKPNPATNNANDTDL